MNTEQRYRDVLELTHTMLEAARNQEWDSLIRLEAARKRLLKEISPDIWAVPKADQPQIGRLISEIKGESAEIIERVQGWREGVKILLRVK